MINAVRINNSSLSPLAKNILTSLGKKITKDGDHFPYTYKKFFKEFSRSVKYWNALGELQDKGYLANYEPYSFRSGLKKSYSNWYVSDRPMKRNEDRSFILRYWAADLINENRNGCSIKEIKQLFNIEDDSHAKIIFDFIHKYHSVDDMIKELET